MQRVAVVGSGASGVHFALSLLKKGHHVVILDVGYGKPKAANVDDTFPDLKKNLPDPVAYFLGERFEGVVYPGSESEYVTKYYGFPPNKSYVFSRPKTMDFTARGFEPLISFARGGLAEAWTAGVYPFNDAELKDFPFDYRDIEPHYAEVARRIGITGARDDLVRFYPFHDNLRAPLRLDEHSALLLSTYEQRRDQLRRLRCSIGRSRVATLHGQLEGRQECTYCGRCLWGCPIESIYTPSITLREVLGYQNCTYVPGVQVTHFEYDPGGRIRSMVAASLQDHSIRRIEADTFVLAAGNLSSCKIYLESIYRHSGEIVKLTGLMDNRQVLVPFINLHMMGKTYDPLNYQYQQLAVGIEADPAEQYVHGQITTLKSTLAHPIIQSMPLDLRTGVFMYRNLHASLGVVNLSFHDTRRETNYVTLRIEPGAERPRLIINYTPAATEKTVTQEVVRRVKKLLWGLGCVVPPGMVHVRPMGASVHYAGTLPMSTVRAPHTTSKECRSHDFENLYIVDGAPFPFLPAKNVTFSLMANAVRVAETVF